MAAIDSMISWREDDFNNNMNPFLKNNICADTFFFVRIMKLKVYRQSPVTLRMIIPYELWTWIFSMLLDPIDLLNCELVCSEWRDVVQQNAVWRRCYQEYFKDFRENTNYNLSHSLGSCQWKSSFRHTFTNIKFIQRTLNVTEEEYEAFQEPEVEEFSKICSDVDTFYAISNISLLTLPKLWARLLFENIPLKLEQTIEDYHQLSPSNLDELTIRISALEFLTESITEKLDFQQALNLSRSMCNSLGTKFSDLLDFIESSETIPLALEEIVEYKAMEFKVEDLPIHNCISVSVEEEKILSLYVKVITIQSDYLYYFAHYEDARKRCRTAYRILNLINSSALDMSSVRALRSFSGYYWRIGNQQLSLAYMTASWSVLQGLRSTMLQGSKNDQTLFWLQAAELKNGFGNITLTDENIIGALELFIEGWDLIQKHAPGHISGFLALECIEECQETLGVPFSYYPTWEALTIYYQGWIGLTQHGSEFAAEVRSRWVNSYPYDNPPSFPLP
jgi:hypothetical protein